MTFDNEGDFDEGEPLSEGSWVAWQPEVAAITIQASATSVPAYTDPYDRSSVTFTATTLDSTGAPAASATIVFAGEGTSSGGGGCPWITDERGECANYVFSDLFPGPGLVMTVCFDPDADGLVGPDETICATAPRVRWTLPASTLGSANASGFGSEGIDSGAKDSLFNLNVASNRVHTRGTCKFEDRLSPTEFRCQTVTAFIYSNTILGPHVTIFGQGILSGSLTDYRIDIEPLGQGHVFGVTTISGYSVGRFMDGPAGKIVLSDGS